MFEQLIKAFQLYKNDIRQTKLKELYQHGVNDNPIVGTHEGATLPHSKYQLEEYFMGFISGISSSTVDTIGDNSNSCLSERGDVYVIGKQFDDVKLILDSTHYSEWTWKVEYYSFALFFAAAFTQLVDIDAVCSIDWYFYKIRMKYVTNWEHWYANIVHNQWFFFLYFFYFLDGAVWNNIYDMAFAVGIYTRYSFEISLEDA